jgi:hypothetical protein
MRGMKRPEDYIAEQRRNDNPILVEDHSLQQREALSICPEGASFCLRAR